MDNLRTLFYSYKRLIRVHVASYIAYWVGFCFVLVFCISTSYADISDVRVYNNEQEETKKKRKIVLYVMKNDNNATLRFTKKLTARYKFLSDYSIYRMVGNREAYRFSITKYSGLRFFSMRIRFRIKDKLNKNIELGAMYRTPRKGKIIYEQFFVD